MKIGLYASILVPLILPYSTVLSQQHSYIDSFQLLSLPLKSHAPSDVTLELLKKGAVNGIAEHFASKYEKEIGPKIPQLLEILGQNPERYVRGYKIVFEKRFNEEIVALLKISISLNLLDQIEKELGLGGTKEEIVAQALRPILVAMLEVSKNGFFYWWREGQDEPLREKERVLDKALRNLGFEPTWRFPMDLQEGAGSPFLEDDLFKEILRKAKVDSGLWIIWNELEEDSIGLYLRPYSSFHEPSTYEFRIDKRNPNDPELLKQLTLLIKSLLHPPKDPTARDQILLQITHFKDPKELESLLSFLREKKLLTEYIPKEISIDSATYSIVQPYSYTEFFDIIQNTVGWPLKIKIEASKENFIEIKIIEEK